MKNKMEFLSTVVCLLFLFNPGNYNKAWAAVMSGDNKVIDSIPIFPVGTKWTYEYISGAPDPSVTNYGFIVYEVTDTLHVNDTIIYNITNNRNGELERMIQMDGKVWFWVGGLNNWQLTYDFEAVDQYATIVGVPEASSETAVEIDSIASFTFGDRGEQKLQHVSILPNYTWEDPLEVSILEGCGNLTGGISSGLRLGLGLNLWDPVPWYNIGKLRCFEQGDFFFNFSDSETGEIACDSVWTVVVGSDENLLVNPEVHWIELETEMTSPDFRYRRYKFSQALQEFGVQMYRELLFSNDEFGDDFEGTGRYFREVGSRVYEYTDEGDNLLYDFGVEDGQSLTIQDPMGFSSEVTFEVSVNSSFPYTLMNGELRKNIGLLCGQDEPFEYWIEGIGSINGFLGAYQSCYTDRRTTLMCFFRNDTQLYHVPFLEDCWSSTSTRDLPKMDLDIWPNPTNNEVHIETKVPFDRVRIFSSLGKQVGEYAGEIVTLSMSNLESGMYFIQVEHRGRVLAVRKVVKGE